MGRPGVLYTRAVGSVRNKGKLAPSKYTGGIWDVPFSRRVVSRDLYVDFFGHEDREFLLERFFWLRGERSFMPDDDSLCPYCLYPACNPRFLPPVQTS